MKQIEHHLVIAMAISTLLIMGCQTNPSKPDESAAAKDADQTRVEGTVVGALLGGLLGSAVGGEQRGQAALIGAVLGGGAGYLVGNEIAKRKQGYATEEDFLDAEIASAQQQNATAAQYNEQLRIEIAELDHRTQLLESRYRSGLAQASELQDERARVQRQIASSSRLYDDLKQEHEVKVAILSEQQTKSDPDATRVKQLEQEISTLQRNMDQLRASSVELARIDERLTV